MDETIQVLNINIDDIKNSNAVKTMQSYLQSDTLNVIEFVTMDTLLMLEEQQNLQDAIAQCDLVLPGDKEVIKAANLNLDTEGKEIENHIAAQALVKYIEKKKKKVFLLVAAEDQLQKISEYMSKNYRGIRICGSGVLKEDTSFEFVVNKMNASGTDCVLAFLPSPTREMFVLENRTCINAKVWIGLDSYFMGEKSISGNPIRTWMLRLLLHRKVLKKKNENE